MQTEHSYKYTMQEIEALAQNNGFEIVEHLFDSKQFFVFSKLIPHFWPGIFSENYFFAFVVKLDT